MPREGRYLTPDELREDFDRIARLEPAGWSARQARYAWILEQLPRAPGRALDLGCGTGSLTRLLAARLGDALGVDLSGEMIARARAASPADSGAHYLQGDFRDTPAAGETFDVVTAIAALHHLPIDEALVLAAARVRPGGLLLVVDLHEPVHLPRAARRLGAWCLAHWDALREARKTRPPEVRRAWLAHGDKERVPTAAEIRSACARLTPRPALRFHLRWRWSLAWKRRM